MSYPTTPCAFSSSDFIDISSPLNLSTPILTGDCTPYVPSTPNSVPAYTPYVPSTPDPTSSYISDISPVSTPIRDDVYTELPTPVIIDLVTPYKSPDMVVTSATTSQPRKRKADQVEEIDEEEEEPKRNKYNVFDAIDLDSKEMAYKIMNTWLKSEFRTCNIELYIYFYEIHQIIREFNFEDREVEDLALCSLIYIQRYIDSIKSRISMGTLRQLLIAAACLSIKYWRNCEAVSMVSEASGLKKNFLIKIESEFLNVIGYDLSINDSVVKGFFKK
jgi:hypothetical protein